MRILSLDQSTSKTGWALIENSLVEEYGLIDWDDKSLPTDDRFLKMCNSIKDLILKNGIEILLMEDTTWQRNAQALKLLSRLQGFIIAICDIENIRWEIIHPSTWRTNLNFKKDKRDGYKKQAIKYVQNELLISDATEDESEALCIGISYVRSVLKIDD